MGFILAPIALILFALVGVINSIVIIIINISRRAFFSNVSKIKYRFAFDVDVFDNYLFAETWNLIFAWKVNPFGIFGETISSVLGRLRQYGGISWVGWLFSWFLDIIWIPDWFNDWKCFNSLENIRKLKWIGHCKASIMSLEDINLNREKYK